MNRPVSDIELIERFGTHLVRFMRTESAGGIVLFIAAVLAMLVMNSPLQGLYITFLEVVGEVRVGALAVEKPLFLWVNDGLMAVFFFLVGLEIKHEILHGHLSDRKQLVMPVAAAAGGVAVPALIYVALNLGDPRGLVGWAIPMATDIAFALGVLALVGRGVPAALKVFLMTLAILDDLFAIIVIALFYTSGLSVGSLMAAAFFIAVLAVLNRSGVRRRGAYVLTGIVLWVCVLKSGVHATLAGVITALLMPGAAAGDTGKKDDDTLVEALHPWVAFGILPLFAFVNAGVSLQGLELRMLLEPVPLGIALGLVLGKPAGVMLFTLLVRFAGLAPLPPGVRWIHVLGTGFLCGIGFTMSLFIGGLAFAEGGAGYERIERLGILTGSMICAATGYAILRYAAARR